MLPGLCSQKRRRFSKEKPRLRVFKVFPLKFILRLKDALLALKRERKEREKGEEGKGKRKEEQEKKEERQREREAEKRRWRWKTDKDGVAVIS